MSCFPSFPFFVLRVHSRWCASLKVCPFSSQHKSCSSVRRMNVLLFHSVVQLIKDLGSWTVTSDPVSGQWEKSNWKPMDTLLKVHKYNEAALFGMGVGTDDKNNTANIITVSHSGYVVRPCTGWRCRNVCLSTHPGQVNC